MTDPSISEHPLVCLKVRLKSLTAYRGLKTRWASDMEIRPETPCPQRLDKLVQGRSLAVFDLGFANSERTVGRPAECMRRTDSRLAG